jgi:hypothetical protein
VYSENGLLVDLAEVEKVVDLCDVFTIIFRLFPERLLVDSRTSSQEGPLVALVEPVATVEERYHWLGRKRPSFGPPESFMFFLWPHSIALLEECGVVARIRRRCEPASGRSALRTPPLRMAETRSRCSTGRWPSCERGKYRLLAPRSSARTIERSGRRRGVAFVRADGKRDD